MAVPETCSWRTTGEAWQSPFRWGLPEPTDLRPAQLPDRPGLLHALMRGDEVPQFPIIHGAANEALPLCHALIYGEKFKNTQMLIPLHEELLTSHSGWISSQSRSILIQRQHGLILLWRQRWPPLAANINGFFRPIRAKCRKG